MKKYIARTILILFAGGGVYGLVDMAFEMPVLLVVVIGFPILFTWAICNA